MTTAVAAPPQTPPPKAVPLPAPPSASPPGAYPSSLYLATGPRLFPITVKQYQEMIEAGILAAENVELIEGYLVEKMSRNPPHDGTHDVLDELLRPLLPAGWLLRTQKAVEVGSSQPEPDFAVVRGNARSFRTRHPAAAEVGVLIEIADSSVRFDRTEKVRVYAAAGIIEYWVVNLADNRIEVYAQPSGPTAAPSYGSLTTYAPGQAVPLTLDGTAVASIPVADVLP